MSDPHWKKPSTWQEELRQRLRREQGHFIPPPNETIPNWQQAPSLMQRLTNWQQPSFPNQVITYYHPTVNERIPKKKHKRTRISFTGVQIACLEAEFQKSIYLQASRRRELSEYLGLSERNITVWFQNKRMKEKNTLKASNEEVATDLRICQPLAQQLSDLRDDLTSDTKTQDDTDNDESDDERLQINSIDVTKVKMMQEPPHVAVSSSDQTGTLFFKLLSESIPEDLTYSTNPQPGTSGIIFKTEKKELTNEITQKIEDQVESQPRVIYPHSGEVSVSPGGSGVVQPLNVVKTAVEDSYSDNTSVSSDNTPAHSPHKQAYKIETTEGNYPYSRSEYDYYHSHLKTYSILSSRPEFESRPRPSVPNPPADADLEECKGPFAPSPDCKCGCHKLGFLTYPFSQEAALTPPQPDPFRS